MKPKIVAVIKQQSKTNDHSNNNNRFIQLLSKTAHVLIGYSKIYGVEFNSVPVLNEIRAFCNFRDNKI